jgi:DNA ligase (NAD+)
VEAVELETDSDTLDALAGWGFRLPDGVEVADTVKAIDEYHRRWAGRRDELDFEIDGIVVKVDDLSVRTAMGATSAHPRWALAYKFEPRKEVTRVEDIAVSVGRTGVLTPVALLRPVDIGGVTVARASLHNREEVRRKDVRVGDLVRVQRAGDVIPEVVERVGERGRKRRKPFEMPKACPACGAEVVVEGPVTRCPDRFGCPAQLEGRLQHLASQGALDIEGLGEKTAELLVRRGLVRRLPDLFALDVDDLVGLEGFAEPSARKLVSNIRESRRPDLDRFLHGLGIPGVGQAVARDLARHFGTLDAVRSADIDELREVPGVGPVLASAIRDFFDDHRNADVLDALLRAEVRPRSATTSRGEPLDGLTFVFTGALEGFTRDEAESLVESLGARATSSVSSRTDYVVVGEDPGQKADDAAKAGVETLDERGFVRLVGEAGGDA